jgi:hypothetical protein
MFEKKKYCTLCGTVDYPRRLTKGSLLIEVVLWLCFLVPGLLYSLWRMTSRYDGCRTCNAAAVVPLTSPVGRNALAAMGNPVEQVEGERRRDLARIAWDR